VKAIPIAVKAFFPKASEGAYVFAITTGSMALPPIYTPNVSGYLSSKVAQVKVMEFLAAEHPEKFICSVHPGLHDTKIFRASTGNADTLPMDTGEFDNVIYIWSLLH
jgi:hypothetical protein